MDATLLLRERRQVAPKAFVEAKIRRVPVPIRASRHAFKYSLALVVEGVCFLRYDNEAGKGDHRHAGGEELRYEFRSVDGLLDDFLGEVDRWLSNEAR